MHGLKKIKIYEQFRNVNGDIKIKRFWTQSILTPSPFSETEIYTSLMFSGNLSTFPLEEQWEGYEYLDDVDKNADIYVYFFG